ncbi:MAG: amidinotransferase [Sphingobacteriia bacterium]|nr:MAG: amidinotransferase [Sphingobacteriia bacterium]
MQHSQHLLMVRPVGFQFNAETAVNNSFQVASQDPAIGQKAAAEFDGFVAKLRQKGVDVTVVNDTPQPHTPDSIFPNNWISFHGDGRICLYPMFAENRRQERKPTVLQAVNEKFQVTETIDLTGFEAEDVFLEGTGSMVLDREKKLAYACLSPRTQEKALAAFCEAMGYTPVVFWALDQGQQPIYHTNVMMCVADRYVVICSASIANPKEKQLVLDTIAASGKAVVDIGLEQMNQFAGNMLQVHNAAGETFLVMSSQAYHSLNQEQIQQIESYQPIIHSALDTIERHGGGSARCMMAEVFLPLKG